VSTLEEQQNARFAALDPRLPPITPPAGGAELLRATTPDGRPAAGLVVHTVLEPGAWLRLWGPAEVWDLTAVPGDSGATGLSALLTVWRSRIHGAGPDSACTLTWPSRDAEAAPVLLAHGFVPQTCLAVRPPDPVKAVSAGVRHARATDAETLVDLRMAELRYAALVGPAVVRPGARELMAAEVGQALRFGARFWLAEDGGAPVGMAAGTLVTPAPGTAVHGRLPAGDWGYFDTLSVTPEARHRGIGRALAAAAHRELILSGVRGTFLFYHPANPLSPVFWHRQGYRPLWTTWARQPAWP